MIHSLLHRFLLRTHFWRNIGFAELSELYMSRMLRILAMKMIAGFIAIYLIQLGYSLVFVAWFYVVYFLFRTLISFPSAYFIAWFGPKHATLVSNIMYIPGIIALTLTPYFGMWALLTFTILSGISLTLYNLSYLVDFSKVKHLEHAGKEIGIMNIVEGATTALSPVIGGLIALWLGPQAMIIASSVLLAVAASPLFMTGEPVATKQRLSYRNFNFKDTWRNFVAALAYGFDMNVTGLVWYLFIAMVVLNAINSDTVYVQVGALASVSVLASIAIAYVYGKVIDRDQGGALLNISAVGTALLHLVRPFISTTGSVAALNVADQAATLGYTMPLLRGFFDSADSLPGYRVAYMSLVQFALGLGNTLSVLILAVLVMHLGADNGMKVSFFVAAPIVLLLSAHGFKLYRRRNLLARLVHAG
jgi:MFS family permease